MDPAPRLLEQVVDVHVLQRCAIKLAKPLYLLKQCVVWLEIMKSVNFDGVRFDPAQLESLGEFNEICLVSARESFLEHIPRCFIVLPQLETLVVSHNAIEEVNVSSGFYKLLRFHATNNRISHFNFDMPAFKLLSE